MSRDDIVTHLCIVHTWVSFTLENDPGFLEPRHLRNICEYTEDAINFLKSEAVKPTWEQGKAYCGSCGKRVSKKVGARYCYKCGRRINWND